MDIRFLKGVDRDGVCELAFQINTEHNKHEPDHFSKPVLDYSDWAFWLSCANSEGGFVLVAESGGEITGMLTAQIRDVSGLPFLHQFKKCRIGTLVVSSDHRRQGIASALFKRASEHARDRGAREINLEVMSFNKGAEAFYESLGFRPFSQVMCKQVPEL